MASFVWMLLAEPTYNRARLTASPGGRGFWARRHYAIYQPPRRLAPSRDSKAARRMMHAHEFIVATNQKLDYATRVRARLSSRIPPTNDGAFMEPRGCNRWQSAANRSGERTGETSQNPCRGLRPIATRSTW